MREITTILLLTLVLNSCGEYQKVLKSDNINYKYSKAVEYYEKEDFNRAIPLFDELSTLMRGTAKAEETNYYYAYCQYSLGENIMAAYLFRSYTQTYPKGLHTEECVYMNAYCYYLETPAYSLDASNNYKAIKSLQAFVDRYPNSERVDKCNNLIDELRAKLAEKAFENAKQYYITENYKSAIIALDNVLIDFPENIYREEAQFLILKSSYLLAINSISTKKEIRFKGTLEAYHFFNDNYPESDYRKEAQQTYKKALKSLELLKKS